MTGVKQPARMTLVAILTVRREAVEKFRAFEKHAAIVMAKHGGRIERTVVVVPADSPGVIKEIHIVTFPDEQSFLAYRSDAQRGDMAHLRDESVVHAELLIGEDGPDYSAC